MTLDLHAEGYHLRLSPGYGATLLAASWQHPDGFEVPLLAPLADPAAGFSTGCFIMAPFANRIADGRFPWGGEVLTLPMNRPEAQVAIHGFARNRAWQVMSRDAASITLQHREASPQHPWRYRAELAARLSADGIALSLSLTSEAEGPLPFGFGLHPYFPRKPDTAVCFTAAGTFAAGDRGLPVPPLQPPAGMGAGQPALLSAFEGLDQFFAGWAPVETEILQPASRTRIRLTGGGAFRHLHVFVPQGRDVFCIEPVSHAPDILNRPELGADGQPSLTMTTLAPGETLSATLGLSACGA
ncbi:MAG: aldose epimerase [Polymorphum sp.]|nr:aldose epimerase [Polymorphum sp.]